ncbi:unnamed protein product [Symbiodinium necroappetens]|uniref:Uncharacterized protein n=1 Tax=Symbiodinium necroappetens TaxID=1628268 RepID=A0A812QPV0_9DINO|nr:unnamed protein product [Symbiodinium necroappetens]
MHVASMKQSFRRKVQEAYEPQGVLVTWPSWDAHVKGQRDDVIGYKDMLLLGSCNVTVVPTGGSTFSYAATAMYHTVSLRDAGGPKRNCGELQRWPYERLFPEPRQQLDLDRKCRKHSKAHPRGQPQCSDGGSKLFSWVLQSFGMLFLPAEPQRNSRGSCCRDFRLKLCVDFLQL